MGCSTSALWLFELLYLQLVMLFFEFSVCLGGLFNMALQAVKD
jgi:hypothetical protein